MTDLQRQFYEMLMDSQWWSAEQLRNYQRSQLSHLLRHARANVPFYEHRLDAVLKPNGDVDWDRWAEIPIVKRRDLIDHRDAMLARDLPPGHGPVHSISSSGSTGVAVSVLTTAIGHLAANGARLRVQRWHDLDWSSRLVDRMAPIDGPVDWPEGTPSGPWGPHWDPRARSGRAWRLNSKVPNDVLVDFIRSHECRYLISGPKSAHLLALESRRLGRAVRLDKILVQSGAIGDDDRSICHDVLGASLIEHYSSKEGAQMAHACPSGRLHLVAENALLELVGADGRPIAPGMQGRVIVTPFFSTAQPLIRYEMGDIATPGKPCDCGLQLPTIGAIIGRTLAVFRHPDGRTAVRILPNAARDLLNCEFWQMAQIGPNDYEVRYVPRATGDIGDEAAFAELFRSIYFEDSAVEFRRLPEIPLTRAGKLLEYVNEWSARDGAR